MRERQGAVKDVKLLRMNADDAAERASMFELFEKMKVFHELKKMI